MFISLDKSVRRSISAVYMPINSGVVHSDRVMSEHDLLYVLEGSWEIWQDGIPYTIGKNDILFLHANHRHYGIKPCAQATKLLYIHFSYANGDEITDRPKPENFNFPVSLNCADIPDIKKYFLRLLDAYWSKTPHSSDKATFFLDLMLCALSESYIANKNAPPYINAIISEINAHPEQFFSVVETSGKYAVSPKKLSYDFKNATGESFHRFQLNKKLDTIRNMLLDGCDIPLAVLANDFGFFDEYHLSKSYKARFGTAPRKEILR